MGIPFLIVTWETYTKMKTILALSLIAVAAAQPWGYIHPVYGPAHYAGSHYAPAVYNTYYPGYYNPYAWQYGVNVAHQAKGHEAPVDAKMVLPAKMAEAAKMVETVEEVDHSDHDYSYDEVVDDILDDEDVYDVDDLGGRNSDWKDQGGRTSKIN